MVIWLGYRFRMLSSGPIQRPKPTLMLWFGIMAISAVTLVLWPQVKIKPDFKTMIMSNDQDRAFDTEAKKTFGDDEMIIVAVENDAGVFNADTLALVRRLTDSIKTLDGVRDIYSLTYVDNIRDVNGVLDTSDLIEELPKNQQDIDRIVREVDANPTYVDFIISADKKVASIIIEPSFEYSSTEERAALTEKILNIVEEVEIPGPEKIYVTGIPVSSYFGALFMIIDMVVFGGVATFVLVLVIWIIFRSWQGIVFTMLVAMIGVCVTYASCTLYGHEVTMPMSSMMVFVMALGMEYSIYVGHAYTNQVNAMRESGQDVSDIKSVIKEAMRGVRGPVLLSSLTTAAAFVSMMSNPVPDLAKMGAYLAIGTLTAGLGAITIVPAFLMLKPFEPKRKSGDNDKLTNRFVNRTGGASARHPGRAFLIMSVVLALCVVGWTRLSTDSDAMRWFKKGSTIRMDEEFVRARGGGTTYLQTMIVAKERDFFKKPENLEKLAQLQVFAESQPNVTKTLSHADHIKLLNQALIGGTDQYKLPNSQAAVEQFLMLHKEPDDFRLTIDSEYERAAVMIRMDTMSSARLRDVEAKVEKYGQELFPGMDVNVIGTTMLVHRAWDAMATSMLTGLGIALVLIWVILCAAFRSIKFGTLALLPNLVPIALIYSVLGWIGQPLDPPTAVTGAITLGIAVDDTVHFFKCWLARTSAGMGSREASIDTLKEIGRPMVMSSLVVGFGFGVMVLSRYGTLVWIGTMLCVATLAALICDLLLTPALLSVVKNNRATAAKDSETKSAAA